MKTGPPIAVSFYLMAFTLAYETKPPLPSQTETFNCPEYANCTGDHCNFHRKSKETSSKPFLTNDDTILKCDPLKVDIFYPLTNEPNFSGKEVFSCFQYTNDNGISISVLEMNLNKPGDVNGTQLTCSVEPTTTNCTLQKETSSQLTFVAGLPSSCDPLVSGTDPTVERSYYCPGHENCSGHTCRFNGLPPLISSQTFNKNEKVVINCDALKLEFNFPDSKDEAFVVNETRECHRYYNAEHEGFAIIKVIINKSNGVNDSSQFDCKANIGDCSLFNETSSEMTFLAGFPNSCVPWFDYSTDETDPSQKQSFYCPVYKNCTGTDCRYNRMAPVTAWQSFNKSQKTVASCESLEVGFTFPDSKDETFVGNETWTCYRYLDAIQHHFAVARITLNKPQDVNGSQVECTSSIGNCTLLEETSIELEYVAGLPNDCVPWTDSSTNSPETTTKAGSVACGQVKLDWAAIVCMTAAFLLSMYPR